MTSPQDASAPATLNHAIGQVTVVWAIVETQIAFMLMALLPADFVTAMAVSSSLDYVKKRDLMNSIAAFKLSSASIEYEKAMTELNGLSKERNAIVHGVFGYRDGRPVRFNFNNRGEMTATETDESVKRIMGVAKKLTDLANTLPTLTQQVAADVKAWHEKHAATLAVPGIEFAERPMAMTLPKPIDL